jgi:hypothetical protein
MNAKVSQGSLQIVACSFPTPEHPCYHVRLLIETPGQKDYQVQRVEANGKWVRDFWVYNDDTYQKDKTFLADARSSVVVRHDWQNGSANHLEIKAAAEGGEEISLSIEFTAPDYGGYWNPAWKYYASVVLTENDGWPRVAEPMQITLGLYADRFTDPEREIRVVGVDPESGAYTEVPCQVYGISAWDKMKDERCQPTTTVEVAFLADVPPKGAKVYLVFYGNPDAEPITYPTDLRVTGEGLGLTVENEHYRVKLHPLSGALDEVLLKQGMDVIFDHHLETNGALHWNPGVYAPPRTWIHASDWDPPAGYSTQGGPVFFMTKRWGPFPYYPEVEVSITYVFYAHNPYILMTSTLDVLKDIDVVALRNGEIVLNHNVVREFAWKKSTGEINSVVIKERPRHPTRGLDIEAVTPWFAWYNREIGAAFGAVDLELAYMRRSEGPSRVEQPYRYMHWGPWTYCARPLIYTFATNNPQRVIRAPGGSTYYEKTAFLPFRLGSNEATRFEAIERRQQALSHPLDVRVVLDTDERVPEEWVPPILVEEFEEMED